MSEETWSAVDQFLTGLFAADDDALSAAREDSDAAGLPSIQITAAQGRLLALLARAIGARRVLEIGTLGGYSTIWLGRALPPGGRLISLEIDPEHARVARANIARAGLEERVEVRVGPAVETLAQLQAEGGEPFDFIFIDADKQGYVDYLRESLPLARSGSLIVADNVVRRGRVADPASEDERVQAVRRFLEALAAEPRLHSAVIQTVGEKGYDGMALALVR